VAANRVGKYRAVADALFAAQPSWAMSGRVWEVVVSVLTPAEQKRVQELAKDPSVASEVKQDTDTGNRVGLQKTPTVGVNYNIQHRLWNQWGAEGDPLFLSYLRELLKR